jgi:hypothetical protein
MEKYIKIFMKHISSLLLPLCFAADVRTSAVPAPMLKIWAADADLVKCDVLASFGALENSLTLDHGGAHPPSRFLVLNELQFWQR